MMADSLLNSPPDHPSRSLLFRNLRPIILFCIILAAYVVQTQLTQYVQGELGYHHPYFLFYLAHSSFVIIFPIHLFLLVHSTGIPTKSYLAGLALALSHQLTPASPSTRFPWKKLVPFVGALTVGVTFTAVLWYIAVNFAPVSDVTALFNTNAFWAYVLAVQLGEQPTSGSKWRVKRLAAVVIACAGVFAVVYGSREVALGDTSRTDKEPSTSRKLIGNTLSLIASVSYAFYQVLYKKYATLPSTDESDKGDRNALHYESLPTEPENELPPSPTAQIFIPSPRATSRILPSTPTAPIGATPVPPPFAFHPNFLTSLIGVFTLTTLWIPIPIMGALNIGQPFALPPDLQTWGYIAGIAISGVIFNGGFMILLGIWGAVVVSVGNLLTIVLVLISDCIFGNGLETITVWSLSGCAAIIGAFAILALDMEG